MSETEDSRRTILVTNDDGIDSPGLHALVEAVAPLARVVVIAPDRNRSGVSRSITLGQVIEVTEEEVPHADVAYSTSGTPTDCVRLAMLELAGSPPDLVLSGANNGLNVGDDIAYSGTVAAAFDASMNGLPAIAVSQQSTSRELGYPRECEFDHRAMQGFTRGLVELVLEHWDLLPHGLLLNVNVPGVVPEDVCGVEIGVPGRRFYRDKLQLTNVDGNRRHYSLYGDDPDHHADEVGTDIAAIGRTCISVTPLRFNAEDHVTAEYLASWHLDGLLSGR